MVRRMLLMTLVAISTIAPHARAGSWLVQGNAGLGVPAGDGGDFFKSGPLIGGSVGYMSTSFEVGADFSWLKIDPDAEYRAALAALGATAELRFLQYGIHARFMGPTSGKLSPFIGVGIARYNVNDKYSSPTFEEDGSGSAPGIHGDVGVNCWVSRSWGIGVTGAYHATFLDDDTLPTSVNTSFYTITGGILFKLGSKQHALPAAPLRLQTHQL